MRTKLLFSSDNIVIKQLQYLKSSFSFRLPLLLFLITFGINYFGQGQGVLCDFTSPVRHKIFSSGSFGEPRSSHFHSGIDIKPHRGAGLDELIAIGDGFVSRIRTTPDGYGKSIYIDHPCGYTSVYAHLDKFNPPLTDYLNRVRMATKKSEIDQKPPPNAIQIKKGDVLGYMGNSGNSFGAHLHFEIRNTNSETPINPALFGIGPDDHIAPVIRGVIVYYLDSKRNVLDKFYYPAIRLSKRSFKLTQKMINVDWPLIGFGLHVYDQSNGASNHNGIHSLEHYVNGVKQFSFRMDSIPFDKSQFLHAHMDYEYKVNNRYVHKCYAEPINKLDIYDYNKSNGLLISNSIIADKVKISVKDISGNESSISFIIKNTGMDYKSSKYNSTYPTDGHLTISPYDTTLIKIGNYNVTVPPNAVMHNTVITCDTNLLTINMKTKGVVPLFKKYYVTYNFDKGKSDRAKSKYVFITKDAKDKILNLGGIIQDNTIGIGYNEFCSIELTRDTLPPTILLLSKKRNENIRFKIIDNYKSSGKDTRLKYNGYVDNKWIPLDYDEKNGILTCEHSSLNNASSFRLIVSDFSKNQAVKIVNLK